MTFVSGKYELEQKLYLKKLFILKNLLTFVSLYNYAHDNIYS